MIRIKELRQQRNMKQAELGRLLNCTPTAVSNYETGYRSPDVETIHALCEIFGCTADFLLGRSEQATPELTEEEYALVAAFRDADDDARAMVRLALKRWLPAEDAKNAAS